MTRSRPAETEELRAASARQGHRLVGAAIGDGGGIGDPACRGCQRAGLFQRETSRVNGWPGDRYIFAGAKDRKRGKRGQVGTGDVGGNLSARRRETAPRI